MKELTLFIGGASDGMRVDVPAGEWSWRMPVRTPVDATRKPDATVRREMHMTVETYARRQIFAGGVVMSVFAEKGMGEAAVWQALIKGYRGC